MLQIPARIRELLNVHETTIFYNAEDRGGMRAHQSEVHEGHGIRLGIWLKAFDTSG